MNDNQLFHHVSFRQPEAAQQFICFQFLLARKLEGADADKAVSILPVGITDVIGEFEKDDIVRIIDFGGKPIGVGKANCDSSQARETMGKHGKKPVVHYDYLYIE